MDRNNMRSNYVNSGPRSLPHMGKRHNGNGHNGNGHNGNGHNGNGHNGNGHNGNGHNGNGHNSNGHNGNGHNGNGHNSNNHNGSRLSPPAQSSNHNSNSNNSNNQQEEIINYVFESWNKVSRELERGSEDARYYQEPAPRQLANFRPFNLEEWWGRRFIQNINRKQRP